MISLLETDAKNADHKGAEKCSSQVAGGPKPRVYSLTTFIQDFSKS